MRQRIVSVQIQKRVVLKGTAFSLVLQRQLNEVTQLLRQTQPKGSLPANTGPSAQREVTLFRQGNTEVVLQYLSEEEYSQEAKLARLRAPALMKQFIFGQALVLQTDRKGSAYHLDHLSAVKSALRIDDQFLRIQDDSTEAELVAQAKRTLTTQLGLSASTFRFAFLELTSRTSARTIYLTIQLSAELCPTICTNFIALLNGKTVNDKGKKINFKGKRFELYLPNLFVQLGCLVANDNDGFDNIYGEYMEDESYQLRFDGAGVLGKRIEERGE